MWARSVSVRSISLTGREIDGFSAPPARMSSPPEGNSNRVRLAWFEPAPRTFSGEPEEFSAKHHGAACDSRLSVRCLEALLGQPEVIRIWRAAWPRRRFQTTEAVSLRHPSPLVVVDKMAERNPVG